MQKNKISPLKGEIFYVIPRRFVSGSPKDTCTFGEKEHASKRVSIIVPDNASLKTKRATHTRPRVNLQRTSKIHQILAFLGGNFFWGPRGSVPVGHMVAFLQCVKHSIRGPRGILCTRGAYGRLHKVGFFIFSKILAFSGRLFLCFFEYRNIMCAD